MAIPMNDSYNRCLAELRERYKNRGVSINVSADAALQAKQEESTRALAPEAYVLFDARSKIADQYRSGEYNGSKYMTSDDFVRYFKSNPRFFTYHSTPNCCNIRLQNHQQRFHDTFPDLSTIP